MKGGTERAEDNATLCGKQNENHQFGAGQFVHQKIAKAVNRVSFVCDKILHMVLRGCCCDVILNVRAPTEYRRDDSKENFNEEFYHFPKYKLKLFYEI